MTVNSLLFFCTEKARQILCSKRETEAQILFGKKGIKFVIINWKTKVINRFFERKTDYLKEIIHFKKRQGPTDPNSNNNIKKINK